MRRKLFTLITALMLVLITSVAPITVAAQGLVESARILVVVGIGENETAEIYFGTRGRHTESQMPEIPSGDLVTWTYHVTNTGDATCTQTLEGPGPTSTLFVSVTTVSKGFGFVTFNNDGKPLELEDECFKDPQSQRVVIQVGDRRFKLSDNTSPFPAKVPVPYSVMGYSIVGQDGRTVASVFSLTTLPNEREFK